MPRTQVAAECHEGQKFRWRPTSKSPWEEFICTRFELDENGSIQTMFARPVKSEYEDRFNETVQVEVDYDELVG